LRLMANGTDVAKKLQVEFKGIMEEVNSETKNRAFRTVNVMYNSAQKVLSGKRSGRVYKIPHKNAYYTASAKGEPPAVRTGNLRRNWRKSVIGVTTADGVKVTHRLTSDMKYASILEERKGRPFTQKIIDDAMPKVDAIYENLL